MNEKRLLWQERIQDYLASQLTATEWCQQNQVKVPTLRYWVNKLNKESSLTSVGTEWLSVKIPVSNSKCFNGEIPCGIKVTIGQASIEVSLWFDHQVLGDVVRILLEQC